MKRWARDYDCCVECGRTDSKHRGKGWCKRCRARRDYAANPTPYRMAVKRWQMRNYERRYQAVVSWRKANPEKVRKYQAAWQQAVKMRDGVCRSARWKPGVYATFQPTQEQCVVLTPAKREFGEFVVSVEIAGQVVPFIPTRLLARGATYGA